MIVTTLFRNEMIKMLNRLAFWVAFLFITFIQIMNFGQRYFRAAGDPNSTFDLPRAWAEILGESSMPTLIFGAAVLILLISSEFSWRTARQNVIDGLSKNQFFWAKAMLVPVLAILFIVLQLGVGSTFAFLGTDRASVTQPLMAGPQWAAIGSYGTAFLGYGNLALFIALAVRNSGPAMAVFFLYLGVLEQLIGGGLLRISERLQPVVNHLPMNAFNKLLRYEQFDPAEFQRLTERAIERERTVPELLNMTDMQITSVIWIAVFVIASYIWFKKRDL